MPHEVTSVANQLIRLGMNGPDGVTPMQVIKLTYLAHGWMLGIHGEPLVADQAYAWRYGPVYLSLYFDLRQYGRRLVTDVIPGQESESDFTPKEANILDEVWRVYGSMDGMRLSKLTHAKNGPWDVVYHRDGENAPIPDDLIRAHYQEKWRSR